eukprot:COSAG02_NODE_2198_length_9544_cov_30.739121_3_plen_114_part_00
MEALYFGSAKGGLNHGGAGTGPWIMADMENALWGADRVVSNEEPINHDFVTAMIKGLSISSLFALALLFSLSVVLVRVSVSITCLASPSPSLPCCVFLWSRSLSLSLPLRERH